MRHILLVTATLLFSIDAGAQNATLKINSDLILHPSQISNVFAITSDQVNKAPLWNWPELTFQKPYKTFWSNVQAKGPFVFRITSDRLNTQEAAFEFEWAEPNVSVGQFSIKDTVVRDLGGVQVVVNLEGSCSGMTWKVSGGNWKVRGRVAWAIVNQQLQVQWKDFDFTGNAASAPVSTELGQCQGPPEIQAALKDSAKAAASDQKVMEDLLRRGILAWMNDSLLGLRNELLRPRSGGVYKGLELTWEPLFMVNLAGGLIRVPGYVWLKKQGVGLMPSVVDRTLPEQDFNQITDSGFVLPKNAIEAVAAFSHATGDLQRRFKSTEIKGFTDLMGSWFQQGFVWPDLRYFVNTTLFYFDLATAGTPQLSNVRKGSAQYGGGLVYDATGPLVIHMHAPTETQYVPYVDFRSSVSGLFRAAIKGQQIQMGFTTNNVPLTANFRPEFKKYRGVNERIDTNRLGKAGMDFLNGKTFAAELPKWDFGSSMKLVYGDLKLFKQSVMLPLSFQKK
jgi:hypothetical protein